MGIWFHDHEFVELLQQSAVSRNSFFFFIYVYVFVLHAVFEVLV